MTNGNNLSLIANEMDFNGSGGIDSISQRNFEGDNRKPRLRRWSVGVYATKKVYASIRVSLPGQTGADGKTGGPGNNGMPGQRGNNGVDGMLDCSHGGTDGGAR